MNFPLSASDPPGMLAAMLALLTTMTSPDSPPIDEGSLSIGFYLFMLEHASATADETRSLIEKFRALVAAIPTAERRCAYMARCQGDLAAWRTRLDAAEVHLGDCFHGLALA